MAQEQSVNQPSISPQPSSLQLSDSGGLPNFAAMMQTFAGGLPSIDQLPVEKTYHPECETIAPRIRILGFSAVICPECRRVIVDEPK
jgi:hypothetical protein